MPVTPHTFQTGESAGDGPANAPRPERLRIGVHQLPGPDIMLVRAFVQMSATFSENFPWVFAEEPPFDLVLIDAKYRQSLDRSVGELADEVLLITDDSAPSAGTMQRPLRYRVLEDWLKQRAVEIRAAPRPVRSKQPAPPESVELPAGTDLYIRQLERWPPSAFLQHDRLRLRVATIMASNDMKLSDLARLCREPEGQIRDCLRAFLHAGLLQIDHASGMANTPSSAAGPSKDGRQSTRKSRPGLGIIASIRRRLGL